MEIIESLFDQPPEQVLDFLDSAIENIKEQLTQADREFNRTYDQVVCWGELVSSAIVTSYLRHDGQPCHWLDSGKVIQTDSQFREAKVDWPMTTKLITETIPDLLQDQIVITQGFIGNDKEGNSTTLGREGSDFSGAILAHCLDAESLTIWKDVAGVMSGDPKLVKDPVKYDDLSYRESAEMTYYGASVIHPKTIRPLALKQIPLFVKSFNSPADPGTRIHKVQHQKLRPALIYKFQQSLITFQTKDLSFIDERQLSHIFHQLHLLNMSINMMQNSAISFSVCVDLNEEKFQALITQLAGEFEIHYNQNLELITVKNYDEAAIEEVTRDKLPLLEQKSRTTYQALVG